MLIFLIMSRVIDQIKTNYLKCQICWARRWLFTLKPVNCNLMFQLLPRKPVISIQSRFDTNSNIKIAQKFQIFFRERKKKERNEFSCFSFFIFCGSLSLQDLTFTNYWNVLKDSIPLVFPILRLFFVLSNS